MITPRSTCCKECADALALVKEIDCKLYELGLDAYNNVVYSLNLTANQSVALNLVMYRRILMYKHVNENYACAFSVNMIASKIKKYLVGCRKNCECHPSFTEPPVNAAVNFSFDSSNWSGDGITNINTFIDYLDQHIDATGMAVLDFNLVNAGTLSCNLSFLTGPLSVSMQGLNITKINNTDAFSNITSLNLSQCSISVIENIDNLVNLLTLDLSYNPVAVLQNMDTLVNLKNIFLTDGQLTAISGLDNLTSLEILFLNNNQITDINDISDLTTLTLLSIAGNIITTLPNIDNLVNLNLVDIRANQLTTAEFNKWNSWAIIAPLNGNIYASDNIDDFNTSTTYTTLLGKGWTIG